MTRVSWTTVTGGVAILLSGYLFYHTFDAAYAVSILTAGRGPVFFPRILLVVMFVLSVAVAFEGRKEKPLPISGRQFLSVMAPIGLTGLYIISITMAGFLISTIVFVAMLPILLGYRNPVAIAVITAVYPVTIWYVFEKMFKIILPSSPWFVAF